MNLGELYLARRVDEDGSLFYKRKDRGKHTYTRDLLKAKVFAKRPTSQQIPLNFEIVEMENVLKEVFKSFNKCAFLLRKISESFLIRTLSPEDKKVLEAAEEASDDAALLLHHAGDRRKWEVDKRTTKLSSVANNGGQECPSEYPP